MRTIKTCPGIGDTIWLFMKLINQPEKFHWKIDNGSPQRGHQIFNLFPQLTESFEYIPDCKYNQVKRKAYRGLWRKAPQEFYLEANSHLEAGFRIEDFLPDIEKTSFILPYATTDDDIKTALVTMFGNPMPPEIYRPKHIGIYTTSYSNSRYMSGWLIDEWKEFIGLLQNHAYKFVFIGAPYDVGLSQELMKDMPPETYINAIGQELPVTIEILKRLEMFIGFQSGLSIINETVGAKNTIMLYSDKLTEMMNTWADPKRIEDGSYKGCSFGTAKEPLKPKQLYDWMKEYKKI